MIVWLYHEFLVLAISGYHECLFCSFSWWLVMIFFLREKYYWLVASAGWLVLIFSERKVLLAGC
jgi:hypothetical protein